MTLKEHKIGTLIPDLIVDGLVIVDTKMATTFTESHLAQMTGYLSHTGLQLGLLLNFKQARLKWKRVACSLKTSTPSASSAVLPLFRCIIQVSASVV